MKIYECSYSNRLTLWKQLRLRSEHPPEPQPSGIRAWFAMLMAAWQKD